MMMRVLTTDGLVEVHLPDEEDRSVVGSYWNAVGDYLRTGRTHLLDDFASIDIGGGLALETDPYAIEEFWSAGELDYLEVYS